MYKLPKEVSKHTILSVVSEEDIFQHYLGIQVKFNTLFCSPLRKDENPTCKFFVGRNGSLYMKDFSGHFFGDCFALVSFIHGCNFFYSLLKIDYDMKLDLFESTEEPSVYKSNNEHQKKLRKASSKTTVLAIKRQKFTYRDRTYWGEIDVTEPILNFYNVSSALAAFIGPSNDKLKRILDYTTSSPLYGYKIDDKFKIYRPFAGKGEIKWLSTTTKENVQGFEQLPESSNAKVGIITKSLKDVMAFRALGIWAIAAGSESSLLPDWAVNRMKELFPNVVVIYDNDEPGIMGGRKQAEHSGLDWTFFPDEDYKDLSDFRRAHTRQETIDLLKILLKDYL